MPRANIQANRNPAIVVDPVFSLSANSTLRNVDIGGGENIVKITGENADVCGSGLGILSSGETNILPPHRAVLIIDGARAAIHRNVFYGENAFFGDVVVGNHGNDSRIGDTLDGSGDSNHGLCSPLGLCAVKILTGTVSSAQRVTIRDAFPRTLAGMPGIGVSGGDDDPRHANNWAQTPTIVTAETFDNFATVHVSGNASPFSLVDIYFDDNAAYTRQAPVMATAAGKFDFWGDLHGPLVPIQIVAVSTLNDPAHPNRFSSSSKFSGQVQVTEGTSTVLQLGPPALAFSALAGGANPPAQYLFVTAPSISPTLAWQTSVTTTDGLNWLDAAPSMGSGSDLMTATVNATGLMSGTYHGTISVYDLAQPTDRVTTTVTLNVTEPVIDVYGVELTPAAAEQSGDPGAMASYTLRITNTGSTTDTFTAALSGNLWPTVASTPIGPLASGTSTALTVNVAVPSEALGGAADAVVLTVTSDGDAGKWASAQLTTTANIVHGVALEPHAMAQSGNAGRAITYTLRMTNTGDVTDTFLLSYAGNAWDVSLPLTQTELPADEGRDVPVSVNIPVTGTSGMTDTVQLMVTGTGVSDTSVEVTTVNFNCFLPLVVRD